MEDNASKQSLIENLVNTSKDLDLNEEQLSKLLKQRESQMVASLEQSQIRLNRNATNES